MAMKPGIYHNIPFAEYRAWPGLSVSLLKEIARSPGHLKHREAHPIVPTSAMTLGSAIDCAVFDGADAFAAAFAVRPDGLSSRTKAGKEWAVEQGDRAILSAEEGRQIYGMQRALMDHPEARRYLGFDSGNGCAQVSLLWQDPETDLILKGRPDVIHTADGLIVDLKSTADAGHDAYARLAYNYKLHWQAAYYCQGMTQLTGEPWDQFGFVVVERDPPYRVEVYDLGLTELTMGFREIRRALTLYGECAEMDDWQTSTGEVNRLEFPGWALK